MSEAGLEQRVADLEAERMAYVRWQAEMGNLHRGLVDLAKRVKELEVETERGADFLDAMMERQQEEELEAEDEGVVTLRIRVERGER